MIKLVRYRQLKDKPTLTPFEQSQMEVFEFIQYTPKKAEVYVKRQVLPGSIATRKVVVTTHYGHTLGYGWLKIPYKVKGRRRYTLVFSSRAGDHYKGTYYSNLNYANVHLTTKQPLV